MTTIVAQSGTTSEEVLLVLSHPASYNLQSAVWYAINAPTTMIESHPGHTLAGRLALTADELLAMLKHLGLASPMGRISAAAKWNTVLNGPRCEQFIEVAMDEATWPSGARDGGRPQGGRG